jgi:cytidylate kinase
MAVITIFRQAGCRGRYIAEETARLLGYHFSDYVTAERLLLQQGFAQAPQVYQSVPDFWDRFTRKGPERSAINSMLHSVTLAEAQQGDAVLLGRGCFAPLQGLSDVLNVRVMAPLAVRVDRVMRDQGMTDEEAMAFIAEKDALVAAFPRTSYGLSPDDLTSFDLVIDTGKVDPDAAVRFLVDTARSLPATGDGRPTAAALEVDPVMAAAVVDEFGRLEDLRAGGFELRSELPGTSKPYKD